MLFAPHAWIHMAAICRLHSLHECLPQSRLIGAKLWIVRARSPEYLWQRVLLFNLDGTHGHLVNLNDALYGFLWMISRLDRRNLSSWQCRFEDLKGPFGCRLCSQIRVTCGYHCAWESCTVLEIYYISVTKKYILNMTVFVECIRKL